MNSSIWAGGMLAKMLPDGLFAGERVALFLRADNNLYHSVNNRWLSLAFYDLFAPFAEQLLAAGATGTDDYCRTGAGTARIGAGGVSQTDSARGQKGDFGGGSAGRARPATAGEGRSRRWVRCIRPPKASWPLRCSHGTLHLNEEFLHIEPQWIDEQRFTPLITDFTRSTQPIVRYRLDDVLVRQDGALPLWAVVNGDCPYRRAA